MFETFAVGHKATNNKHLINYNVCAISFVYISLYMNILYWIFKIFSILMCGIMGTWMLCFTIVVLCYI